MSDRNTDSLLSLAEAVQRRAPVLKTYLPPSGLALRFANGAVISAAGLATNTVMEANAAQRALYRFLCAYPKTPPRIAAAAIIGHAGENPCALADLLILAAFFEPDAVITAQTADGLPFRITDLQKHLTHVPQARPRLCDRDAGGYTLVVEGQGVTPDGTVRSLSELSYPAFRLTDLSDPTDLTPVRALMADLQTEYTQWNIDRLVLRGSDTHGGFPLSGRDLQVLRRDLPDTTAVLWNGAALRLVNLMPGAYQSNYTRFPDAREQSVWQEIPAHAVIERLGDEVTERVIRAVQDFAIQAPVQPPRVAAAILADGSIVCAGHVPLHGLNVPSCAEAHAIRRAMVAQEAPGTLAALVLLIHENHTDDPLLGVQAAPCGFCREHIRAACAADAPVILTDGRGRFQWANAGDLLWEASVPQLLQERIDRNPIREISVRLSSDGAVPADLVALYQRAAMLSARHGGVATAAALTSDGDVLAVAAPCLHKPDCDYPPNIGPEFIYRGAAGARLVLLYHPQEAHAGQLGAYLRYWLAKVAENDKVNIHFASPSGIMPTSLRVRDVFGDGLSGFDFAANGRFVDGRSLHFHDHPVITGKDVRG